jgi:hypothetical protein
VEKDTLDSINKLRFLPDLPDSERKMSQSASLSLTRFNVFLYIVKLQDGFTH